MEWNSHEHTLPGCYDVMARQDDENDALINTGRTAAPGRDMCSRKDVGGRVHGTAPLALGRGEQLHGPHNPPSGATNPLNQWCAAMCQATLA